MPKESVGRGHLVVWWLDRLGRNFPDLVQIVADVARRYGMSRTTLYKYVGVVAPR